MHQEIQQLKIQHLHDVQKHQQQEEEIYQLQKSCRKPKTKDAATSTEDLELENKRHQHFLRSTQQIAIESTEDQTIEITDHKMADLGNDPQRNGKEKSKIQFTFKKKHVAPNKALLNTFGKPKHGNDNDDGDDDGNEEPVQEEDPEEYDNSINVPVHEHLAHVHDVKMAYTKEIELLEGQLKVKSAENQKFFEELTKVKRTICEEREKCEDLQWRVNDERRKRINTERREDILREEREKRTGTSLILERKLEQAEHVLASLQQQWNKLTTRLA